MKRMTFGILNASLAAVLSCMVADLRGDSEPTGDNTRQPQVLVLNVEQFTLANGLKVILHEDHKTPVVSVNVWYKVGSKDEQRGRTGFAHLFEHLMFQGSQALRPGLFPAA